MVGARSTTADGAFLRLGDLLVYPDSLIQPCTKIIKLQAQDFSEPPSGELAEDDNALPN